MIRVNHARLFSLATFAALAACTSGGETGGIKTGGSFLVLSSQPVDNATLFLNDAINVDFSNAVDLSSVNLTTFNFGVTDQLGNPVSEPVAGTFSLAASPGDADPGRRLVFSPRLPTNDQFNNGGFRPGRVYEVRLVGGSPVNGTVIRDTRGKGLEVPKTIRVATSDGTTPAQLFRNPLPGGPRRIGIEITPTPDSTGVVLNKLGTLGVEIRLHFDQPLNPSSANVPVAIPTDPLTRSSNNRGRIFLEYDDPVIGESTWIPADVELEINATTGSTVSLRPLGVLPNNATVRVIVERTLEDISGESNVSNAAYDRIVASFRTQRSYEQQFDAIVDSFEGSGDVDLSAAFAEPVAEVGPGFLKAGFAFEGTTTGSEFEPAVPTTILNTDFTSVVPKTGAAYQVSGGVFNFKSVTIPAGRTVIGQGTRPMVWLCAGTFEVAGVLSVRGGDGQKATTTGNANVPKQGGAGACNGGDGGDGSPGTTARDLAGGTGDGAGRVANGGGVGGSLSCTAGCNRGSAGGGGSLATQGDPWFKQLAQPPTGSLPFAVFQQQTGIGGNGCAGAAGTVTRSLQGGVPGPIVFSDARNDNNFWGVGVRFDGTPLRITGELALPVGGGGGGGGGDLSYSNCDTTDVNFENDKSGGGGGGGGGVLIVKALGPIIIADGGRITADGGSGGGGEPSGSSNQGGGGGAGAGGMVVLMSATRIDINARGSSGRFLYGSTGADKNDYDFAISADGGVCVSGTFGTPQILRKYVPTGGGQPGEILPAFAALYDSAPLGGFGGMGIVQLMAPPGTTPPGPTSADQTATVLDDNIRFLKNAVVQSGAAKKDLLAWRGFPNALGQGVDDLGQPTNIGANEGDIRPSPILMPVPFGTTSRLRSFWVDTGASNRIPIDNGSIESPRAIVDPAPSTLAGPRYEFAGVDPTTGYATYTVNGSTALATFPTVVAATALAQPATNTTYLGEAAYLLQVAPLALGSVVDRYSQYEAEALDLNNQLVGSFRILTHTDSALTVSAESGPFPAAATQLRVKAKFYDVVTSGFPGLGSTYLGASAARVPVANVRIGFAFHQNPADPLALRFPATAGSYAYNLSDPAVQEQIRALHASFVQWDILFDTAFKSSPSDAPPPLSPDTPRPELHFLRLPFRF